MKKFETPVIKIAEFSKENIATTASLTAVDQANADAAAVKTNRDPIEILQRYHGDPMAAPLRSYREPISAP